MDIWDWIFGKGNYNGQGILTQLGENGILGINDLLMFFLSCSANRSDCNVLYLVGVLATHKNPQAPTTGDVQKIVIEEMREMSQVIFHIFKSKFIDKEKDFFAEIDGLALEDFATEEFVALNEINEQDLSEMVLKVKFKIKKLMFKQFGGTFIKEGIGCGYYDMEGNEDKKGINLEFNKYLFEICFNPEKNENNYANFLDCLLFILIQMGIVTILI